MSSQKQRVVPYKVITATAMGASINGSDNDSRNVDKGSYLIEWSAGATPVGTGKVQAAYERGDGTVSSWVDIPSATLAISGNTGSGIIIFDVPGGATKVRLVYVRTSGDGTLDATFGARASG